MPKQSSYIPGRKEVGKLEYLYGAKDYPNIDMWRQPDAIPEVRLDAFEEHLPDARENAPPERRTSAERS